MPFPNEATQFRAGHSGNPAGHSRGRRLTDALIRQIDEKLLADPLARVGIAEALKGDFNFWRYIFERVDGRLAPPPPPEREAGTLADLVGEAERRAIEREVS